MLKVKTSSGVDSGTSNTDIAFLLIIFFMVSITAVVDTGVATALRKPEPDTELQSLDRSEVIVVELPDEGEYLINGESLSFEQLFSKLGGLAAAFVEDEPKMSIKVADQRSYGELFAFLDVARDAGIGQFSVASYSGLSWGLKVKKLAIEGGESSEENTAG